MAGDWLVRFGPSCALFFLVACGVERRDPGEAPKSGNNDPDASAFLVLENVSLDGAGTPITAVSGNYELGSACMSGVLGEEDAQASASGNYEMLRGFSAIQEQVWGH